jgi:hypothetical protein
VGLPLVRRVLFPRLRPDGWYSSALPYLQFGRRVVIGAQLIGKTNANVFASTSSGPWKLIAIVEIGNRKEDNAIRFNPWNSSPALPPTGVINAVRKSAYAASQQGWPG